MALSCDDGVTKPQKKSTTSDIKTSDVTTYDGPSLGCISLDGTPSLNEVLDAMADKICSPVSHTHATSDVTDYDGGFDPSCFNFTASPTLNSVIEDLATQICTVSDAIPTGFNSSEITYDGYDLDCAYESGGDGINSILEGLDDAVCSLYDIKVDKILLWQVLDDLICNDYVEGGLSAVTSGGSLTPTINSGVAYVDGIRLNVDTDTVTLVATRDNYVDLNSSGAFIVSSVTIGNPAPAVVGQRLWKLTTDGSGVTASEDLRNEYPFCGGDLSDGSVTEDKIPDDEISSDKLTDLVAAGETEWANVTVDTAGRVTAIDSDVQITTPQDDDILVYDSGLGKWINTASIPGAIPTGSENETIRYDEYGEPVASSFLINDDSSVGIGTTENPVTLNIIEEGAMGILMKVPDGVSATIQAGGSLGAQTNYYVVTALDGAGGETLASSEVSGVTDGVGTRTVQITWAPVPGNAGYRVYHGTTSGSQTKYYSVAEDTEIYTDDGMGSSTSTLPPTEQTALTVKINSSGDSWFLSDTDYPYYVGFGTATPDATVDIVGTLQYIDGTEATGYVLVSDDEYGNATWAAPSTISPYEVGSGTNSVQLVSDSTNDASGDRAGILTGIGNSVDQDDSTIIAGSDHTIGSPLGGLASIKNATILGGRDGVADRWGVFVYSPEGAGGDTGATQTVQMMLSNTTTGSQTEDLNAPNSGPSTDSFFFLKDDSVVSGIVILTGVQISGSSGTVGDSYSRIASFTIKNVSGTGSLVGSVNDLHQENDAAAAWTTTIDANNTPAARLRVEVQGVANKDIEWTATIIGTERRY